TLDWAASAKIYLSSAIAYLIPLFILSNLDLSYWRGLFLGLITLPPVYSLLLTLTRALDEADIRALKIMVKAVGPLAPILRLLMILIDIPIRKKRSNQLGD
ncbi:MAG: hypothetical protein QXK52_05400, partial [Candidatus Bathyarchaeia archaeon]